ncbi:MAG: amidohydrolase [Firmicutes bacterium]|nr:amidohydrolase [Bacillota bacterium]
MATRSGSGQASLGLFGWCIARPAGAAGLAAQAPADLVLVQGNIYTVNPRQPRAEAVAIRGEYIVAVGSNEEIRKWVGPNTRVVDLGGRFAMPGFNDAHIHLASGGAAKLAVDLSGAESLEAFQERIRARLSDYRPGEWITGRGWDHTLWDPPRFPTRADLDAVSREHPILLTRVDGHVAVANSLALQRAGVTRATPDPPGGEIQRDSLTGEPTGLLKETAMGLVARTVPALTPAQRRRGIELALAEAAQLGVTSLQDNSGWDDFLLYRELRDQGRLTVRITEWLPFQAPLEQLLEMRRQGGVRDRWLKTGALKGVTDGTLGSRTAAMLEPYADDRSTRGILRIPQDELRRMVIERDAAGFQIALHAIGDLANRAVLDAFEAAQRANGRYDARHRIEHAQVVAPDDFARFAALGVIASMQPVHQSTDMRWAGQRLGPERSRGAYAWRTMLRHGVRLALGTDYPVEPMDPRRGLYACATRELPEGGPAGGWVPEEKISVEECIQAYTLGSAYAEFEEQNKGQIVAGQYADIVVFAEDLTRIPPRQILTTPVVLTLVGGRIVYEKP